MSLATTSIALPLISEIDDVTLYEPFEDGRYVVVRTGDELGHDYASGRNQEPVSISGVPCDVVNYNYLLHPFPAARGEKPVCMVIFLPDAEVGLQRSPNGFSDEEVDVILQAIRIDA